MTVSTPMITVTQPTTVSRKGRGSVIVRSVGRAADASGAQASRQPPEA